MGVTGGHNILGWPTHKHNDHKVNKDLGLWQTVKEKWWSYIHNFWITSCWIFFRMPRESWSLFAFLFRSTLLYDLLIDRVCSLRQGRVLGFIILVLNGAIMSRMVRHLLLKSSVLLREVISGSGWEGLTEFTGRIRDEDVRSNGNTAFGRWSEIWSFQIFQLKTRGQHHVKGVTRAAKLKHSVRLIKSVAKECDGQTWMLKSQNVKTVSHRSMTWAKRSECSWIKPVLNLEGL